MCTDNIIVYPKKDTGLYQYQLLYWGPNIFNCVSSIHFETPEIGAVDGSGSPGCCHLPQCRVCQRACTTWQRCEWALDSRELRGSKIVGAEKPLVFLSSFFFKSLGFLPLKNIHLVHFGTRWTWRSYYISYCAWKPSFSCMFSCFRYVLLRSGQLNFTEETVKVVVSLGEDPKHRGLGEALCGTTGTTHAAAGGARLPQPPVASLEGRCQEVGMGQVMKFPEIGVPWGTHKSSIFNHVHGIFL